MTPATCARMDDAAEERPPRERGLGPPLARNDRVIEPETRSVSAVVTGLGSAVTPPDLYAESPGGPRVHRAGSAYGRAPIPLWFQAGAGRREARAFASSVEGTPPRPSDSWSPEGPSGELGG